MDSLRIMSIMGPLLGSTKCKVIPFLLVASAVTWQLSWTSHLRATMTTMSTSFNTTARGEGPAMTMTTASLHVLPPLQSSSNNNSASPSPSSSSSFVTTETEPSKTKNFRSALLDCDEIARLQVVRRLGSGAKKAAFEVKLPGTTGVGPSRQRRAVAKRCRNTKCYGSNLTRKEANLLRSLHNQYGDFSGAVRFLGECDKGTPMLDVGEEESLENNDKRKYDDLLHSFIERTLSNFSVGHTVVIELGDPLLTSWGDGGVAEQAEQAKCFAEFFAPADVEDLKEVARRYANLSSSNGGPMVMIGPGGHSDNKYPQQYAVRLEREEDEEEGKLGGTGKGEHEEKGGEMTTNRGEQWGRGRGTILHVDTDMVIPCEKWRTKKRFRNRNCSFEYALKINCRVISALVNDPELDCSFDASSRGEDEGDAVVVPDYYGGRINVSRAAEECAKPNRRDIHPPI